MRLKFCEKCPRKLTRAPTEPCHLGVLDENGDSRCPWGINSAIHNNCFWVYLMANSDENGRMDPVPDREIANLLGITEAHVERIFTSAINKLKSIKDGEEMQQFRDDVLDVVASMPNDNAIYMPDNFRMEIKEEQPEVEPEKKKRRDRSMPLHRDGKKTDLYGITSRKNVVKK